MNKICVVEEIITINCTDKKGFHAFFDHIKETDPLTPPFDATALQVPDDAEGRTFVHESCLMDLSGANFCRVSNSQNMLLFLILLELTELPPSDPKRVPPCSTGNLGCLSKMKCSEQEYSDDERY